MTLEIQEGYVPGLIGRIASLSVCAMAHSHGFGQTFEARVARDAAEFSGRLHHPNAQVWRLMQDAQIMGTIAMDGEDLGPGDRGQSRIHLRWFMFDPAMQGQGMGRKMLMRALAFADQAGFEETHLWTIKGLDAAGKLYADTGFELVEEYLGDQWGAEVNERHYMRQLSAS